jgi:hypothetical protein
MAQENFLRCCNCSKWGQPWRLGKRTIVCNQRGHTLESSACKYFTSIESLPPSLQKIRLYVQTLDDLQRHYFQWSLAQAQLVITLEDTTGSVLCLGDRVSFRLGKFGHAGVIEGVDPHTSAAVVVRTPAFQSNVSVYASKVSKITDEDACHILSSGEDLPWQLPVLIQEIIHLRANKKKSKGDWLALVHYEHQLIGFEKHLRQEALGVAL